jgi:hypothetical protein
MAIEVPGFRDTTRQAAADLRTKQYFFVKLDSSGNIVLGDTAKPYGILQNKPNTGEACEIMKDGISKVSAAAGNTQGNLGGPDANGQFAAYAFGTDHAKYICAEVVEDADAGNGICSVAFSCFALTPSA